VSFRGLADRIDRAEDGTLLVLDYKTGKKHELAGRLAADPVDHGTRLQLPIYALAARRGFGADAPVEAHYWYVSAPGGFEQIGFAVGHEELGRFAHVLGVIVSGIEAGAFPGRPGKAALLGFDNCRWCAFDPICPTDRDPA
jgi:hypothetical protein